MLESTTFDLGMDWASIGAWVDEWKAEVGDVIVQDATASTNAPVYTSLLKESGKLTSAVSDPENSDEQTQTRRNSLAIGQVLPTNVAARDVDKVLTSMRRMSVDGTVEPILGSEATCNGSGDRIDVEVDSEMFGDDGLDEMLDGLNLGCLLLDEADMADGTQAITMPHLPPLVVPTEDDEKEQDSNQEGTGADAGATGIAGPAVVVAAAPGSTSENLSTVAKEMLGSGSTNDKNALDSEGDAEDSAESVMAQLLHLTTASLASLHPSIVSDKPLYAFFRPAAKFDATCAPDDILPDFDIPEIAYTPAPKHIEQLLSQKSHLEPGKPMFITNDTEDRDVIGDSEKMWRQARTSMYQDIFDQAAEHAMDEMDNAPPLMVKKYKDGDDDLGLQESHGSELLILEEDILDLDMGTGIDMDMDMDVDLDLDFDNVLDIVSGNVPNAVTKDSTGDTRDVSDNQGNADPKAKGGKNDAYPEAEEEDRRLNLPVSSGLRGSGKPHWSNEWFTPAMRKRLTSMTASDVVPFDSLFVTDPWASRRLVVDEVARAFVDSEGGGHLHATTPLEGFGPAANTYTVPNSSGSALRWTLHHIMQSKNTNKVDSLYTGRSSLAGGVSGDGVGQYIGRMCSLIKASVEEEAELVVNGALGINKSKQEAKLKAALDQGEMIEQLVVGADKRIPWAQNRLDIHVIESRIANREPQKADPKQHLLPPPATFAVSRSATPALPASSDHHSADNSSGNQSLRAMSPLHSFSVPERRDSEVDIGGQVVEHNPTPPAQEQEQEQEQVQETQDQIHKVVEHTEKPLERSQQQELPEQTVEMSEKSEQQRLHYLEEDNDMFI
ncbi:hypothetical protein GGF40_003019 [Coemansia sp. RSA 1286]|nr:hypothetical protein GGF40_003019 [Coemansia sp. RSA 1286]